MKNFSIKKVLFLLILFISIVFNVIAYYRINNLLKENEQIKIINKVNGSNKKVGGNMKILTVPYYTQRVMQFSKEKKVENQIVFLGDSITESFNWEKHFNNYQVINRGIMGDSTKGILDRLSQITEIKPRKIFIMIGVNDLLNGIPNDKVIENYQKIISNIKNKSKNSEIIIQTILPVNENNIKSINKNIVEINKKLKEIAKQENLLFIELHDLYLDKTGNLNMEFSSDGVHLNEKGYAIWIKKIEKIIK